MTGRGPGPTVPATPRPTSPPDAGAQSAAPRRAAGSVDEQAPDAGADAPASAPAAVPPAEPEPPGVSDGDRAPAPGTTAESGRSEDAEPTPYAGPPDDAATTFEDLPSDLFGEPEPPPEPAPAPAPARSDASPSSNGPGATGPRSSGPRSTAPREEARRSSAAPRRAGPTDAVDSPAAGSPADETRAGSDLAADPAIDMVQTFFPGRIVALEPAAEGAGDDAPEDETADIRPDDAADGGPDDGAARPSG